MWQGRPIRVRYARALHRVPERPWYAGPLGTQAPCVPDATGHRCIMSSDPLPQPDAQNLYQAALHYLARYATTEAGLRRVLTRRVERWSRAQTDRDVTEPVLYAAGAAIDGVVTRLAEAGAVNDAAFAESRAKGLTRSGQSTRSIQLRLVAKGVTPDMARSVSATDAETELAAALVLARKRRIGPYRTAEGAAASSVDAAVRMKEMGLLARAGFSRDTAQQALDTGRDEAENRIFDLRRQ
jgi:regulatory protein